LGKEINQVIKIIEKVTALSSNLESIEQATGLRTSASFELKQSISSLNVYLKSLSNPSKVSEAKIKKVYSELRKQAIKEGKTIDVKRLEVKSVVSEIKELKLQYKKEQDPKEKSSLQSKLKLASNKCAKKHKELAKEQLLYAEVLLENKHKSF